MEEKTMRKHVVTYSSLVVIAITLLVCFSAHNNYTLFVLKKKISSFLNIGLNLDFKLMLRVLSVSIDNTSSALLHASLQMP